MEEERIKREKERKRKEESDSIFNENMNLDDEFNEIGGVNHMLAQNVKATVSSATGKKNIFSSKPPSSQIGTSANSNLPSSNASKQHPLGG